MRRQLPRRYRRGQKNLGQDGRIGAGQHMGLLAQVVVLPVALSCYRCHHTCASTATLHTQSKVLGTDDSTRQALLECGAQYLAKVRVSPGQLTDGWWSFV